MGFGIIHCRGKSLQLTSHGVINLSKVKNHGLKLQEIFSQVTELLEKYHPDELAIEAPFFGKNVQSMLKLGRAQGVAIAAALSRQIPYTEYAPRKIKQSITGNGNASKEQVASMVCSILNVAEIPKQLDATDGLAAALCHHYQSNSIAGKKSYSSWSAFIKANPGRTS